MLLLLSGKPLIFSDPKDSAFVDNHGGISNNRKILLSDVPSAALSRLLERHCFINFSINFHALHDPHVRHLHQHKNMSQRVDRVPALKSK
jgi:hypothetical protein